MPASYEKASNLSNTFYSMLRIVSLLYSSDSNTKQRARCLCSYEQADRA